MTSKLPELVWLGLQWIMITIFVLALLPLWLPCLAVGLVLDRLGVPMVLLNDDGY